MKIIVTEQQYTVLVNEVNRVIDFNEDVPEYDYKSVSVLPDKDNSTKFRVFFNGTDFQKTDYKKPFDGHTVAFYGPNGDFEFDEKDVRVSKTNSPYVFSSVLNDDEYFRLSELITKSKVEISEGIKSYQIIKALSLAFPDNWEPETKEFTSGLRGIHTIGEKLNTDESWSIMNYFDTKNEVKEIINQAYTKSDSSLDIVDWLIDELRDNDKFVRILVDRQWKSIKTGLETEELAQKLIGTVNATFYPPGSKMDRYSGVDMTYEGVNYQIKPLISYSGKKEGPYTINTYGMRDYKDKPLVDKILFVREDKMLEFDNKDYVSIINAAVFTSLPTKVTNVK